jgi:hypothetical protein
MQTCRLALKLAVLAVLSSSASAANLPSKVEAFDLAPAGQWLACSVSPRGVHTAVLMPKAGQQSLWLDGIEGPVFDELLPFDGRPYNVSRPLSTQTRLPVAFSDDGEHHGYLAKSGSEYIVYRNSQEIGRGKHGVKLSGLTFSAGAKHFYFIESDTVAGTRLVMDGKPEPFLQEVPKLVFSLDGARYAYVARKKGEPKPTLFVDGQESAFGGDTPAFTRDGKSLVTVVRAPNSHTVLVDGKPLFRARHVYKVYVSPYGDQIISAVGNDRGIGTHLRLFEKPIPESECGAVRNVFFSPDGKRYAALCSNHAYTQNLKQVSQGEFIFLNGKRGPIYQKIRDAADTSQDMTRQMWINGGHMRAGGPAGVAPGFTAESKFVYMPSRNFEEFVVVEDQVSEAYTLGRVLAPVVGGGKRVGYIVTEPKKLVVIGGEARELTTPASSLSFSADGSRYAYIHTALCVDGVDLPLSTQARYLFSPSGKNLVVVGLSSALLKRGLFIDGELVLDSEAVERPVFTPDSKHLLWFGKRADVGAGPEAYAAFVDGVPAVAFREFINTRDNWEMSAAGVLTFVARAGDALRRFRITPASGDGIAAMLTAAKSSGGAKLAGLTPPAVATQSIASQPQPPTPASTPAKNPPPVAPAATPTSDPTTDAAKKATDTIDNAANKAKAWLESLGKKKK